MQFGFVTHNLLNQGNNLWYQIETSRFFKSYENREPRAQRREHVINEVPNKAEVFLKQHIQSVWQLELLQFLKSSPQGCSCSDIAKSLYMSPEIIESALKYFEAVGLVTVVHSQAYKFSPSSVELQDAAEQTLQAYVERRTQVVKAIFSRPYGHWEESHPADGD